MNGVVVVAGSKRTHHTPGCIIYLFIVTGVLPPPSRVQLLLPPLAQYAGMHFRLFHGAGFRRQAAEGKQLLSTSIVSPFQ